MKRFWDKTSPCPNTGCLLWTASANSHGYGMFKLGGRWQLAHRVAYVWAHPRLYGPLPKGLCVLHKCDNPLCVNPKHLFLGTHTDNMRDKVNKGRCRGRNTDKTHCDYGHEFTEENTYVYPPRGVRQCRTCKRERERRYYAKKKRQ